MFNHGFAYWIYGAMSVLAAIFVIKFVPETKGRTLEAIQDIWEKRLPAKSSVAAGEVNSL
jgi:SP family xylose:H+ symportor-like MFS transporter